MRRFYFLLYGVHDEEGKDKSIFISTKDTGDEDEDGIGVLSRSASALLDYYKRRTGGEVSHQAADNAQPKTVSEELRKTEDDERK